MRVLARGRITRITTSGQVHATTAPRGPIGPIDTIGSPAVDSPTLIAAIDGTGDLVAICGTDGLTDLIQTTVAASGSWADFQTAVAAW